MTDHELRASILIPTHNRPTTLRLAVESALAQSVPEIEVLLIGDGVTAELRAEALALQRLDERVVFLDHPKSANHGEPYRHDAILSARSDAIFYLCDDDLLLPEHVADLLALLETHNFVQSLNGQIRPTGEVDFYPANLSDPETIRWHLRDDVRFNSVSITGTAHSREFYLRVNRPWTDTPAGWWPDHYQWCKLFASDELRAATSERMTAIQLPTTADGRDTWTEQERLVELTRWAELVRSTGGQSTVDSLVRRDASRRMERDMRAIHELSLYAEMLATRLGEAHEQNRVLGDALLATRATVSWRITRPLRALRTLLARIRR